MMTKDEWTSDRSIPDLRILIIEPSSVTKKSVQTLSATGCGTCRVPRLKYFEVVFLKTESFKSINCHCQALVRKLLTS